MLPENAFWKAVSKWFRNSSLIVRDTNDMDMDILHVDRHVNLKIESRNSSSIWISAKTEKSEKWQKYIFIQNKIYISI